MTNEERQDMWRYWIATAQQCGRLTPWEDEFLTSISEQLEERGRLSERQVEVLEKIYAEKTR